MPFANGIAQETTASSSGTGNLSLNDLTKFREFQDEYSTGGTDVFHYFIRDRTNGDMEFGTGHLADATTLARDTVIWSTNGNSLVSFNANIQQVTNEPAEDSNGYLLLEKIKMLGDLADDQGNTIFDYSTQNLNIGLLDAEGYLQPDGLTIANNSTDSDHDIDVTGGQVAVHDFNGNWKIINAPDETAAIQIDSTGEGGRIDSSSLNATDWYEGIIMYDSTNETVGYGVFLHNSSTDNTPTSASDLPGTYDMMRAMGSPGKSWWFRTDGSSNIYSFIHRSDGTYWWGPSNLENTDNLIDVTSVPTSSPSTIGASGAVPPVNVELTFNSIILSASASMNLAISGDSNLANSNQGQLLFDHTGGSPFNISGDVTTNDQTIRYIADSDNTNAFRINAISKFKAVG